MRIGLIADIHGNYTALDTVLRALDAMGTDQMVCLGDVCVLGPQPRECLETLQERGCATVLGNTDDWILRAVAGEIMSDNAIMRELTGWCVEQLSDADVAAIRSFAPTLRIQVDRSSLLCFHGSPQSHDDVISTLTPDAVLDAMLAGHQASVWAGGHTHVQLLRRHRDGRVINPGSVGLPGVGPGTSGLLVNRDVTWAEFAIVTLEDRHVSIDLRRIPLDMAAMLDTARSSGMPHLGWWTTLYVS